MDELYLAKRPVLLQELGWVCHKGCVYALLLTKLKIEAENSMYIDTGVVKGNSAKHNM